MEENQTHPMPEKPIDQEKAEELAKTHGLGVMEARATVRILENTEHVGFGGIVTKPVNNNSIFPANESNIDKQK